MQKFFKSVVLSFSSLLIVAGIGTAVVGCAALTKDLLKDPEVKVLDFAVKKVTMDSVAVDLKLNINNPNPIPLQVSEVGYNLKFSGQNVTEGVFDKGINIPANGANDLVVPLTFRYNAFQSLVSGYLNKTLTREYELSGSAKVGIFSIPFIKKGEVQLNK